MLLTEHASPAAWPSSFLSNHAYILSRSEKTISDENPFSLDETTKVNLPESQHRRSQRSRTNNDIQLSRQYP